jgi:hypothetical protein
MKIFWKNFRDLSLRVKPAMTARKPKALNSKKHFQLFDYQIIAIKKEFSKISKTLLQNKLKNYAYALLATCFL